MVDVQSPLFESGKRKDVFWLWFLNENRTDKWGGISLISRQEDPRLKENRQACAKQVILKNKTDM